MSNEEKRKLDNITMLQNKGKLDKNEDKRKNVVCISNVEDVSIRREKTQREKIEDEMKKWTKKVIHLELIFYIDS